MDRKCWAPVIAALLVAFACAVASAQVSKAELIEKVTMYKTSMGRFAPLYPAFARQMVQDYGITKGTCVDVGCGVGSFSTEIAKITDLSVYALDIDPDSVRLAQILVDEAGLTGRVIPIEGDAQNMPFKDEFADLVFSRGSIPFWPDRVAGLRECYRILKPGGVAYVGGGFTSILDPKIRNPIALEHAKSFGKTPPEGFKSPSDLDKVALQAGIPAGQFRMIREPIAGWWLEIKKLADHAAWYRRWNASLEPWAAQIAREFTDRLELKRGRALELGWGAGSLAIPLATMTKLQIVVGAHDADAAKVANESARALGYADRVQAVGVDPYHLMFDDNTFDYVVGHAGPAVWEHPDKVFREIARVLRPRGVAIVGTGVPLNCPPESEKQFRMLAKQLREAADAPQDGFKHCPTREIAEGWVAAAGVKATIIDSPGHHQWIEIRK